MFVVLTGVADPHSIFALLELHVQRTCLFSALITIASQLHPCAQCLVSAQPIGSNALVANVRHPSLSAELDVFVLLQLLFSATTVLAVLMLLIVE
jgi:hypothetical protein